jgi:hypothetical protein
MKTIIIQYEKGERIDELVNEVLKFELSSKASLARRAILFYCNKILGDMKDGGK